MRKKLTAIGLRIVVLLALTCFNTAQAAIRQDVKPVRISEAPRASIPKPPPAETEVTYQTPLPEPPPVATPAPTPAPVVTTPYKCGDNEFAAFIYGQESGGKVTGNCNPTAQNAGGCLGIGQACPGSKLTAVCPNLDYACENAFFTAYALDRYGSWAAAYQFWIAHNYW